MAHEFAHEPDAHRYTLTIDGTLAGIVDYAVRQNTLTLPHTFTDPAFRGHGYAAQLVEYAVGDIESTTDYRIVPACSFAEKWFDDHPERGGLLSR